MPGDGLAMGVERSAGPPPQAARRWEADLKERASIAPPALRTAPILVVLSGLAALTAINEYAYASL